MLVNLSQLQNLGFNIMDLPGAYLGTNGTAVIPQKALNSVPKGKTLTINLDKGQHVVANHKDFNSGVCFGTCTAPPGS